MKWFDELNKQSKRRCGSLEKSGIPKRKRPEEDKTNKVITVSKPAEGTYADIFRRVKAHPELIKLVDNVSCIRRTQKGDVMLELNKSKDKFLSRIGKSLGQDA